MINSNSQPINLVFLWHMHQPDYRNHTNGEIIMPWVLLHCLKDYTDMAYHLEENPNIKAVINFVPVLCEQIEDFQNQLQTKEFRLPLLKFLSRQSFTDLNLDEKQYLVDNCFTCNQQNMIKPFPAYFRLWEISQQLIFQNDLDYLSEEYFSDILTWYFLAWLGESIRKTNPLFQEFVDKSAKGEHYDYQNRCQLLLLITEIINNLMPRYRDLQNKGQIEISFTPKDHPISPLLIDFASAQESLENAQLPPKKYPDGITRVNSHIDEGIAIYKKHFNQSPNGLWPAEGAISEEFINIISTKPIKWIASGGGVLMNSLAKSQINPDELQFNPIYSSWQFDEKKTPVIFFRDEKLSDLIGFEYAKWNSKDAANDLVKKIEALAKPENSNPAKTVSIMLDGENAWEYYPYNGYYFFETLYKKLGDNPKINLTTYSTLLEEGLHDINKLANICAGSWVYGNLSTWIGDQAKNRAWELLVGAKIAFDEKIDNLSENEAEQANFQLSICESSDWFWWFGDYNPSLSVTSFDNLFRQNLKLLYKLIKITPPEELNIPISAGNTESDAVGTMRTAT